MLLIGLGMGVSMSLFNKPRERIVTQIEQTEIEVVKEVEVVKFKFKDRIRTKVVTKPDGTKIETVEKLVVEEKEDVSIEEQTIVNDIIRSEVKEVSLPSYRIGFQFNNQFELKQPTIKDLSLTGGIRLGNLPLFVTGELGFNIIGIGLSYEF